MEMNFIFKFLELMKKLRLNKETIARLNNPEQIYGGATVTTSPTATISIHPVCPSINNDICIPKTLDGVCIPTR